MKSEVVSKETERAKVPSSLVGGYLVFQIRKSGTYMIEKIHYLDAQSCHLINRTN